ncbi:MAG: DNA/RNA nuclease SfsA [SAR324 cluster bacterium]|nr:DNA/RNA nuclease SfsA [SAR324 cluster bacterium]
MPFPEPQLQATFLGRPQRFLAEMVLSEGTKTVAYCPNPGSLAGCLQAGSPALLWDSEDPKRKRRYTLRAVAFQGVWLGTDTHLANTLVERALLQRRIPGLDCYETLEREKGVSKGHRVDFLLTGSEGLCFVEVKSATVVEKGVARFPDSITPRGLKHLEGLTKKAKEGHRVVLLYLIQRGDAESFTISKTCYPVYAKAFKKALKAGVEALALAVPVSSKGFGQPGLLPLEL